MRVLIGTRNPPALQRLLPCVAPVAALAIVVFWSARDGGYPVTSWYPGGVAIAALLAVQVLGGAARLPSRAAAAAIASLLAYAVLELASILWASSKGAAWDAANRTFVYAFLLALFAASPIPREARSVLVCLLCVALALVGIATLLAAAGDTGGAFLFDRLSSPTGYANATAALFLIPFWAGVALAGDPRRSPWVRGPALGAAGVLAGVALVPESRGAVYAAPVVAVVLLLVTPYRIRTALALGLAVAPTAVLVHTFTRPYAAPAVRAHATREAAYAAIAIGVALALAGTLLALVDRRFDPRRPPWYRYARLALAVVAIAGAAALLVRYDPRHVAHRAWVSFRAPSQNGGVGGTRLFGNLGSNRYDFWRVALDVTKAHPVAGVGADNFSEAYLQRRRSQEQPQYPHSVELGVLSQTGVLGGLLFAGFLGFAAAAVIAARRRDPAWAGGVAAGATAFAYWMIHGSVDWLWEFPALAGAALALLGLAVSGGDARPVGLRRAPAVAAAVLALALAASFVPPWLAARQTDRAAAAWRSTPGFAYSLLDQAAGLDPLSDTPAVTAMTIAAQLGDAPRMAASARAAIARDPHNWYSRLQLGVALAHEKRWAEAAQAVATAHRLNPGEPLIGDIGTAVRRRRAVALDAVNVAVLGNVEALDPRTRPSRKAG